MLIIKNLYCKNVFSFISTRAGTVDAVGLFVSGQVVAEIWCPLRFHGGSRLHALASNRPKYLVSVITGQIF